MLGLDSVGEAMVSSLADAAALSGEAEQSSPAAGNAVLDGKRLAALQKLVELANGPAASFLGSGWVRILRTLSALDSLVVSLLAVSQAANLKKANRSCKNRQIFVGKQRRWFRPR